MSASTHTGERPKPAVEIGLGFRGDHPLAVYGALAAQAEAAGFDVLSVFGDLLYQAPLPVLIEMARATSRVRLGAACWNPYTSHPYEIANQMAALDEVSQGRAYLGLARGSWLGDIGVDQPSPVVVLHEAVQVIRQLLTTDASGFDGRVFRLAPGAVLRYPTPKRMPRVLLGTWSPRTAALAGRVADEVKIGGTANPAMVRTMRERIAVGEVAANRPLGSVDIVAGAVTVVDEDGQAARLRARAEVAMYVAVVADLDPNVVLPEGLLDEVKLCLERGENAAAGELIDDSLLDCFAFAGTPEQVADQAGKLIAAGASRIEFGPPYGLDEAAGITLLGGTVLPALAAYR